MESNSQSMVDPALARRPSRGTGASLMEAGHWQTPGRRPGATRITGMCRMRLPTRSPSPRQMPRTRLLLESEHDGATMERAECTNGSGACKLYVR